MYLCLVKHQIMKRCVVLLILGALTLQRGISLELRPPRIAVIGGGIGGASASHFLTELLNGTLHIDLYEANAIGGRLASVKIDKDEVEAGGTIIHPRNMYMQRFVELLGLKKNYPTQKNIGIWDGDEFVFLESNWWLLTLAKLFYKYGFQPFTLKRYINNMIEDFAKIYELQDAGQSFANVTALLSAMNKDFPKLLQISVEKYLLEMGYSKDLINQLVQTAIVVNYGQEVDIQSFVGCVSLATDSDIWSVKDGNKRVPEYLIYRNDKVNVVRSRVTKIRYVSDIFNMSHYEVTYINKDSTDLMTSTYDIVIIAAPLTRDQKFQIEFAEFPNNLVFPGNYQTTYVTFVKADLNPKYFDLEEALDYILSCNPNKTKISSIGKVVDGLIETRNGFWNFFGNSGRKSETSSPVWKIFSRKSLEKSLIDDIFSNITATKEIVWKAYPRYSTEVNLDNFKLHDELYHVNVIEWAASAMEMSAIAGRNVAILVYNDLLQKSDRFVLSKKIKDPTKKLHMPEEL